MKANELMIGDWVYAEGLQCTCKIVALMYSCCNTDCGTDSYENIKPIPLTAEILEKNGFERGTIVPSKFYRIQSSEQIMLRPYDIGYDLEYVHWNESNECDITHRIDVQHPMKHVHELQHALRLCGLTDLADNFKV